MNRKSEVLELNLCAETIDLCAERVQEFLAGEHMESRDRRRFSLTIEEILLRTLDREGAGAEVRLNLGTRLGRSEIMLSLKGPAFNVLLKGGEDRSALGDSVMKHLGLEPDYSYSNGCNIYHFRVSRKRMNPFLSLMITLASAAAVGFLGLWLLSDSLRGGILNNVLTPLYDTFLNVLGCIAGPMVFLSVAWGIYGIGDAAALKRIGKRMMGGYVGTVFLTTLVLTGVSIPFFALAFTGKSGVTSKLGEIFSMILNIFPGNIFAPFEAGNTLQIIFLAVCVGVALLFLGHKTSAVARAVEQINYIVQFLIEVISRLVPYFIFIVVLRILWSDTAEVLTGVGKLFLIFVCLVVVLDVLLVLVAALRCRVSPVKLVRKGLPTLIIALTTASSAAAFGTNMKACRTEYGIDDTVTSFGLPLGIVVFKPTTALNYLVACLFFAEFYHVEVSVGWLVMLIFSVPILAIATPPIPGGAMTAYSVLFAQMGIPPAALAIALACDAIFDFLDTGSDQFLMPLTLLGQANKIGLVDRDVLTNVKKQNERG